MLYGSWTVGRVTSQKVRRFVPRLRFLKNFLREISPRAPISIKVLYDNNTDRFFFFFFCYECWECDGKSEDTRYDLPIGNDCILEERDEISSGRVFWQLSFLSPLMTAKHQPLAERSKITSLMSG